MTINKGIRPPMIHQNCHTCKYFIEKKRDCGLGCKVFYMHKYGKVFVYSPEDKHDCRFKRTEEWNRKKNIDYGL